MSELAATALKLQARFGFATTRKGDSRIAPTESVGHDPFKGYRLPENECSQTHQPITQYGKKTKTIQPTCRGTACRAVI